MINKLINKEILAVLFMVLSFLFIGNLWYGYNEVNSYIPAERQHIGEYSAPKLKYPIANCFFVKGQKKPFDRELCEKESSKELNEYIKDKRDLVAQEGMWKAASEVLKLSVIQLWLLVISTIFTIYSVFLIRDTLDETRKAAAAANTSNDIARISMEHANRSWCDFFLAEQVHFKLSEKQVGNEYAFSIKIRSKVLNFGSSPARNVTLSFWLVDGNNPNHITSNFDTTSERKLFSKKFGVVSPNSYSGPEDYVVPNMSTNQDTFYHGLDENFAIEVSHSLKSSSELNGMYLVGMVEYANILSKDIISYYKVFEFIRTDNEFYTGAPDQEYDEHTDQVIHHQKVKIWEVYENTDYREIFERKEK
ncbi:hypothetical protein [Leucothrix arctica]|uniref:Uncharacterized protein n=1 Tax=Leucothrix arctica TaxID=1481894 RepID=A0A317CEL8_9GAMM|nr:hypothetical protein [Leucothrix arctica]PWQ96809.1 hypothetical protein DKT75_08560 [Leucothrix arctica]